jgi:hypothetical protein
MGIQMGQLRKQRTSIRDKQKDSHQGMPSGMLHMLGQEPGFRKLYLL